MYVEIEWDHELQRECLFRNEAGLHLDLEWNGQWNGAPVSLYFNIE